MEPKIEKTGRHSDSQSTRVEACVGVGGEVQTPGL